MRCPSCGHDNRSGIKFCSRCGRELVLVCPACEARNEPGERFCGECGQPLIQETEKDRRKRALAALRALKRRVKEFCGAVERFNELADVGKQIREFVEGPEARDLLPGGIRDRLADVAEQLEKLKDRTERLTDVCDQAQKVLKHAERCLQLTPPWLAPAAGVAGTLGVVAAAVLAVSALADGWPFPDGDETPAAMVAAETPTSVPPRPTERPTREPVAPTDTPSGEGILRIGLLVPFTGDLSEFGPAHLNAALLAVNEINAAGGVLARDIEIARGDTATDASQGVSEAERLIRREDVHAIVGALASGVTLPVAESVTGPGRVLQISPASTSPALTYADDNDFLFRTTISDAAQGLVLADMAREMDLSGTCTMYVDNAYGRGLSEAFTESFEEAGGTVTAQVPVEPGQATYTSELAECTEWGPDAIVVLTYPDSAGIFLREAVEGGDVDTFLFSDGARSTEMFDALGWETFHEMRGTGPRALDVPAGAAFDAAYRSEYGEIPPLPFMKEVYDAVYLIALAAERAGSTEPTAIRDALRGIANPPGERVEPGRDGFEAALELIAGGEDVNYEGASGPVDLDENGDVIVGAIEVWQVNARTERLDTQVVFKVDLETGEIIEAD